MTARDPAAGTTLADFANLRLGSFAGLVRGTTKAHVVQAVGPVLAEGCGAGPLPLWMTVHALAPPLRLTAWYLLGEDWAVSSVDPDHPVLWIERPIVAADVVALLEGSGGHHPPAAQHLVAWPERGLCVRFSRRLQQPTLLFGFTAMAQDEFDRSVMAQHD